jgi:hypothetical protein
MYEIRFLRALGLTVGIETLILFIAARNPWKPFTPPITTPTILICSLLSSGLTLPYVWFLWPAFVRNFVLYAVLAEAFAIVAEAGIFMVILRISPATAFGLSVLCNACSAVFGKLLATL